jgi:hypothetical protein
MRRMLLLLFAAGLPTPGVAQPGVAQELSAHFCKPNQIGGQASITGEYQNQGPLLAVENMILTCPIITITAQPSAAFNVKVVYDSSAVTEAKPIVCKLSRLKSVGSNTVGDEVAGFPGVSFGSVDLHIDLDSSNTGLALNVECRVSKGLKVLSYILRQPF